MFEDALTYPLEGDDASDALVIGCGISAAAGLLYIVIAIIAVFTFGIGLIFLPIAFVPYVILVGYYVAVLESTVDGDEEPPAFDDWGQFVKDGLVLSVVGIVYYLPATIATLVFVALAVVIGGNAGLATGELGVLIGGDGGLALIVLGTLIGGVLALAGSYLFPAAMANYAVKRSIGATFEIGTLSSLATSRDYAVSWLVAAGILILGSIPSGIASLIPLIGLPISAAISFFFAVAASRALGLGYARTSTIRVATDESPAVGTTPGTE